MQYKFYPKITFYGGTTAFFAEMTLNVGCVLDIVTFTDSSSLNTTNHHLWVGESSNEFY